MKKVSILVQVVTKSPNGETTKVFERVVVCDSVTAFPFSVVCGALRVLFNPYNFVIKFSVINL